MPAPGQQGVVIALLDNRALLHHHNPIGGLDRRKAVGDQNAGRVLQDEFQRLLDLPFGERVDAGSRFIQDEDGWLLHQDAH